MHLALAFVLFLLLATVVKGEALSDCNNGCPDIANYMVGRLLQDPPALQTMNWLLHILVGTFMCGDLGLKNLVARFPGLQLVAVM